MPWDSTLIHKKILLLIVSQERTKYVMCTNLQRFVNAKWTTPLNTQRVCPTAGPNMTNVKWTEQAMAVRFCKTSRLISTCPQDIRSINIWHRKPKCKESNCQVLVTVFFNFTCNRDFSWDLPVLVDSRRPGNIFVVAAFSESYQMGKYTFLSNLDLCVLCTLCAPHY